MLSSNFAMLFLFCFEKGKFCIKYFLLWKTDNLLREVEVMRRIVASHRFWKMKIWIWSVIMEFSLIWNGWITQIYTTFPCRLHGQNPTMISALINLLEYFNSFALFLKVILILNRKVLSPHLLIFPFLFIHLSLHQQLFSTILISTKCPIPLRLNLMTEHIRP